MHTDKTMQRYRETQAVQIAAGSVTLEAGLNIPEHARGVVLFAHGSGSSRHSPHNKFVAQVLREGGGAGAALLAAAERPDSVAAVASRGGRPDLAGPALARVRAPTLLIVGGHDFPVTDINQKALELIPVEKKLAIIPGATHLLEEPGALHEVSRLARQWFEPYLPDG